MPAMARADIGWVEIDVTGAAPERVVTYMDLGSLRLQHTIQQADLLANAPADSNTAALSRELSKTNIWVFNVMRVFEGNQRTVELRDIHDMRMTIDCASGALFTIRTDRIRKESDSSKPPANRAESFTRIEENRSVPTGERWHSVVFKNACNQMRWRSVGTGRTCLDWQMEPLGMECIGIPDLDYLRMMAGYAMNDPAQNKRVGR
ncbi:hypothetical protein CBR61_14240 [Porphyrobacter sp. CACIAM 03H1]|nr:hypothetical protein CBR61_14240 [Porphyrobacter sp. CACIAM 03H1]